MRLGKKTRGKHTIDLEKKFANLGDWERKTFVVPSFCCMGIRIRLLVHFYFLRFPWLVTLEMGKNRVRTLRYLFKPFGNPIYVKAFWLVPNDLR